jgi:hypothetical protein
MASIPRMKKLAAKVGRFFQQYGRKKHPRHDPNDRSYDRSLERKLKQLPPEELSALMNGDPDEEASGSGEGECDSDA